MFQFLFMWLVGFGRLVTTPIAWRCYLQAIKEAKASNRSHSGLPRVGFVGYSALAWIVTAFWWEDGAVWLVEKTSRGEWVFLGDQISEDYTPVDYYTGVDTPVGVIPFPWVDRWFPLAVDSCSS